MEFEDLKNLYLEKKEQLGVETYKHISKLLKEAKEIMLLQVASSEDETAKSYVFWLNPILKDKDKRQQVENQLDEWTKKDEMIGHIF